MAEIVRELPAIALLVVRPIVCASRIDIGTSVIMMRGSDFWIEVKFFTLYLQALYIYNKFENR
jgi:hypothetical protein